jgi:hypothetical protein
MMVVRFRYDIGVLAGVTQWQSACLPSRTSRVRIPSPAPLLTKRLKFVRLALVKSLVKPPFLIQTICIKAIDC